MVNWLFFCIVGAVIGAACASNRAQADGALPGAATH
jgi:hypothetical protein